MSEHDFDGDDDIFSKSGRFGGNAEKRKDPAKPGGFGKSGNAGKPKDSTASSAGEGDAEAMRHLEHEFAAIDGHRAMRFAVDRGRGGVDLLRAPDPRQNHAADIP